MEKRMAKNESHLIDIKKTMKMNQEIILRAILKEEGNSTKRNSGDLNNLFNASKPMFGGRRASMRNSGKIGETPVFGNKNTGSKS